MPSSPDSSSDSSGGSPHHTFDGPNVEAENCLPGVVSSKFRLLLWVTRHAFSDSLPGTMVCVRLRLVYI